MTFFLAEYKVSCSICIKEWFVTEKDLYQLSECVQYTCPKCSTAFKIKWWEL
jgi:hypothetical protein